MMYHSKVQRLAGLGPLATLTQVYTAVEIWICPSLNELAETLLVVVGDTTIEGGSDPSCRVDLSTVNSSTKFC